MPTLSVYIICKNESATIVDCLESVSWADEIIVLDSGSTDNTVELAKAYTDKVYINDNWQGFGVQKQRAQSYTTGDWVLSIDADERVTPELKEEIINILGKDDRTKVYAVPVLPNVFGCFLRHGGWYPAYKIRLYPSSAGQYGEQKVHEKLEFKTPVSTVKLKNDLLHFTYRDLEHYLVKSAHYASAWAEQRQTGGKTASLSEGVLHGIACFLKIYIFKAGFLDGRYGFLIALLSAHSTFVKYADLWSRRKDLLKKQNS